MIAEFLKSLLSNSIFLTSLVAFAMSQSIKAVLSLFMIKGKKGKGAFIALTWSTGGMPSSHSALVSSMSASAAISEGIGSNIFALTFFFAMVIIRDALGVRRAAGLQAKALNNLGRDISERFNTAWQPVKEIQGHGPFEVAAGVILGVAIAFILHFLLLPSV
jgi:acid phosphatase family membrane protein YuiD